jgi:phage FluMu protein Com
MPIRFRCAYCNQLMGIARRKAGTVVRCPACASQVTVPFPAEEGAAKMTTEPAPPIFERSDFDELFNPGGVRNRPVASAPVFEPSPPAPTPAPPNFLKEPEPPAPIPEQMDTGSAAILPGPQSLQRPGYWLDPKTATLLMVAAVVALALAFAAGMFTSAFLLRPKPKEDSKGNISNNTWVVKTDLGKSGRCKHLGAF